MSDAAGERATVRWNLGDSLKRLAYLGAWGRGSVSDSVLLALRDEFKNHSSSATIHIAFTYRTVHWARLYCYK